jgi:replicative DNA helicase
MTSEKAPPHNVEAEEAVLGSLLVDPDAIMQIASWLKPDDFYEERNRWAYDACISLYERDEAINQITLSEELARKDKLVEIGGAAYLSHLVSILPTSVHIEHYADIVSRLSMMRKLLSSAGQIAALAYAADPNVDSVLSKAENMLFKLRHSDRARDFVHISQPLEQYFEEGGIATRISGGHPAHVSSGFHMLDELLGGLQRSDLIVLAARPSLGKSSLALSIARNAAVEQGCHVAIFSLEMGKEQMVQRLLAGETGVDSKRLRLGLLTEGEERKVVDASGILAGAPIYMDDSAGLRVAEMTSKARRLHYEHGIDILIVDYLQLMQGDVRTDNRVQEISDISRALKSLAKELDIPVLAVSQLSRAVEGRTPHTPLLSDLRDSGSIEQDADVVLFIYRDEVYFTEEEWERKNPDRPFPKGIANIIVAKHRNGPVGRIDLQFVHRLAKFDNLMEEGNGHQEILGIPT